MVSDVPVEVFVKVRVDPLQTVVLLTVKSAFTCASALADKRKNKPERSREESRLIPEKGIMDVFILNF